MRAKYDDVLIDLADNLTGCCTDSSCDRRGARLNTGPRPSICFSVSPIFVRERLSAILFVTDPVAMRTGLTTAVTDLVAIRIDL